MAPEQASSSAQGRPKTSKFKPVRPTRPPGGQSSICTEIGSGSAPPRSSSMDISPTIPPELLTRLLHEFFQHDSTRMSTDASALVAKYMETFVKEALARATLERTESGSSGGAGDKFLEVEDLEKLAPQLLLDF
ncbi:MAG: hypothetical protein M1823_001086 [Watsoniomyces obsoletus]|nr:MAG: hypothetical protein M1823_001086 [Watsoniomyces obsoletus]